MSWPDGCRHRFPFHTHRHRRLLPHDARLFVGHSVPFDYDPDAAEPTRWLAFLDDLREDDADSIAVLTAASEQGS